MARKVSPIEPHSPSSNAPRTFLNGWKEIARYVSRGVRTVQRWETLGLPVRRPNARLRSAVVTTTAEIDAWLRQCGDGRQARAASDKLEDLAEQLICLRQETKRLDAENESLRRELDAIRNPQPPSPHLGYSRDL